MIDKNILEFMNSLSEKQLEVFKNNFRYSEELTINNLVRKAHNNAVNKGFWDTYYKICDELWSKDYVEDIKTAYINQCLILTIGEISEAVEGLRKGDADNFKEELADVYIRLSDLVGALEIDIEEEIKKKMEKNKGREKMHGKLF
jgi:NTP pyrophosphatase (non-canonical NTP hydrolase)